MNQVYELPLFSCQICTGSAEFQLQDSLSARRAGVANVVAGACYHVGIDGDASISCPAPERLGGLTSFGLFSRIVLLQELNPK